MEILVEENDIRLDKYLCNKTEYSRSLIQSMLENDYITVNNKKEKPSYKVKKNDLILIKEGYIKDTDIIPSEIPIDIVYEDKDIIIVNKPSGLVVHPGNGNTNNTLANGLMYYTNELSDLNGEERPGIVHRIDKDTSGLLLVAKNNKSHEILSECFQHKKIPKRIHQHSKSRGRQKNFDANANPGVFGRVNLARGQRGKNPCRLFS